jgi:hypothetical protein
MALHSHLAQRADAMDFHGDHSLSISVKPL